MAFNISNATYGRDSISSNKLVAQFDEHFMKIRHALVSNFSNVEATVNAYWSGEDAKKFLKTFQESIDKITVEINKYRSSFEEAVRSDYKDFQKNQSITQFKKI